MQYVNFNQVQLHGNKLMKDCFHRCNFILQSLYDLIQFFNIPLFERCQF